MKLSTERILTTHTGSLPRPAILSSQEERTPNELREAVAVVVQAELDAGIDVINDGEASKFSYAHYVTQRLTGFGGSGVMPSPKEAVDFPEWAQNTFADPVITEVRTNPACIGPIAYEDTSFVKEDIANLKAATNDREVTDVFLSAASPGVIAVFLKNQHYATEEEYLESLGEAMRVEYEAINRAGITLQIDCPDLAMTWNWSESFSDTKEDFRKKIALRIEVLNYATRNIPPEDMRIHLCWGNYNGPHHLDIPLNDIIDEVLKARPIAFSFEGANPRHEHEWKVFEEKKLPEGKVIVPGIIDSTTNYVEHPELVAQRIVRYARLVGMENMLVGSDCGFATFADYLIVDPRITWAKLSSLAEGAQLATKQLRTSKT